MLSSTPHLRALSLDKFPHLMRVKEQKASSLVELFEPAHIIKRMTTLGALPHNSLLGS